MVILNFEFTEQKLLYIPFFSSSIASHNMLLDQSKPCLCNICNSEFPSKSQLFKHLEDEHGLENAHSKPCKVVLIIGWLAGLSESSSLDDEWIKEAPLAGSAGYETEAQKFEFLILEAIHDVDFPNETFKVNDRPKGFSRCSSSSGRASYLLGVEEGCHRACEVICYQGKRLVGGKDAEPGWIDAVNAKLPTSILILVRHTLPSSSADFHAEAYCSQQVFEYMLPLNTVMPTELAIPPSQPIVRRKKYLHELKADRVSRGGNDLAEVDDFPSGLRWESEMDEDFPSDTGSSPLL